MKYRELVESQDEISSVFVWNLLQLNNSDYEHVLNDIMDKADEDIPEHILLKLKGELWE